MRIRYRTRQGALRLVSGSEDESCDEVSKDQVVQALLPSDQQAGDAAGLVAGQGIDNAPISIPANNDIDEVDLEEQARARSASRTSLVNTRPERPSEESDIEDEEDMKAQAKMRSASGTSFGEPRLENHLAVDVPRCTKFDARPKARSAGGISLGSPCSESLCEVHDVPTLNDVQPKPRSASGTLLGNLRSESPSEVRDASTVADLNMRPRRKIRPEKPYDIHNTLSNADSDVRTMVRPTGNGRASLIDCRYIRPHDIRRRCPMRRLPRIVLASSSGKPREGMHPMRKPLENCRTGS